MKGNFLWDIFCIYEYKNYASFAEHFFFFFAQQIYTSALPAEEANTCTTDTEQTNPTEREGGMGEKMR